MKAEKDYQVYDWMKEKGFPAEKAADISDESKTEIRKYLQLLSSPQFEEIMVNDGVDMAFAEKVISFAVYMLDRGDWNPDQAHEYFIDMLQEARDENLSIDIRREIRRFGDIIHSIEQQSGGRKWETDKEREQMCEDAIERLRRGESIESVNEFYNNQLDRLDQ